MHRLSRIELPTLALICATYGLWVWAIVAMPFALAIAVLTLTLAMHASITHEVLHGHPTSWQALNAIFARPGLTLFIPYGRFRDTHLAHHRDEILTDPYDDPESNYLDPEIWAGLSAGMKIILQVNNTMLGRMKIGPLLGTLGFIAGDIALMRKGNRRVRHSWLAHILWTLPVIAFVQMMAFPLWAYLIACYLGQSLIRIRSFLEHRAHQTARARTVIIEDRGPLAFLFLNNNFHVVHHMHPALPWYRLPTIYFANSAHYLRRNNGYRYASYAEVFRAHFLRPKDPVAHPLHARAVHDPTPANKTTGLNP